MLTRNVSLKQNATVQRGQKPYRKKKSRDNNANVDQKTATSKDQFVETSTKHETNMNKHMRTTNIYIDMSVHTRQHTHTHMHTETDASECARFSA